MATNQAPNTTEIPAGQKQFRTQVFPAELEEVNKRQKVVGLSNQACEKALSQVQASAGDQPQQPSPAQEKSWWAKAHPVTLAASLYEKARAYFRPPPPSERTEIHPSTELELVGLAFSGGGIRSATFNLGVLQALAKHGVLTCVDYLSTVSGGGYIGSCLSSLLNSSDTEPEGNKFPFRHEPRVEEPVAIKHLRNSGNYIAPGGLLDTLRIPALLLRGVLINLLVMLPYVVAAVWLTKVVYGPEIKGAVDAGAFDWKQFYAVTPWVAAGFLAWVIIFPVVQRSFQRRLGRRNWYEHSFGVLLLAILLVALIESLPTALVFLTLSWWQDGSGNLSTLVTAITFLIPYVFAGKASENVSNWTGTLAIYVLGLLGPLILLLMYFRLGYWNIIRAVDFQVMYGGALILFVYTRMFVNMNVNSPHSFYRDRLSQAYLLTLKGNRELEENDEQRLSALNGAGSKAPYHLINVALNLHDSKDPHLRGRHADFFIFSKHFVGGERTGFTPTHQMEKVDGHLDLGTAMAISGAAAAPNMGTTTIKPLVFIMTMLNIRLGYWLPNPSQLKEYRWWREHRLSPLSGVGPVYLVRELFSFIDEESHYVNVSDGGHLENLAVYELLRRRCKFIIAGDAEADETLTFGGLATLMRYARIDLGIDIDIELDDVRKREDGYSRKHCAFGKIRYGNGETGYLLYIKSSVTGDENEYIRAYRSSHPTFPHESTADQFFDEAQFEAYRALGFHITNELFPNEEPVKDMATWFENLESDLRPRFHMEDTFIELQEQLSDLEREFFDPDVAEYTYQIYPELLAAQIGSPPAPTSEEDRKIFHLGNLQMQLMENVYIALQLDKPRNREHHLNRGWMNLFRRWAQSPLFRQAWAVSIDTYSVGFQLFCEEALGLQGARGPNLSP